MYSLDSPPDGGTLEQEKPRYFECEETQTDSNIEHKGLDSDARLILAHPCLAVKEVQKGCIARDAAIGHDYRCQLSVGQHINRLRKDVKGVIVNTRSTRPGTTICLMP